MKRLLFIAAVLVGLSPVLQAVQTPIYPVMADKGIAGEDIFVFGPNGGNSVTLSSAATSPAPPEGFYSMRANGQAGGSWGIFYLNPPDQFGNRTNRAVDLSAYAATGEMRVWANCSTDSFSIFVQNSSGQQRSWNYSGTFGSLLNQWVSLAIPLNSLQTIGYPINSMHSPFGVRMNQAGTCYFDNVRYVLPSAPFTEIFSVTVKDIATQNTVGGGFTWPAGILPTGWARASQYIELNIDNPNTVAWGVQIYTKNTSAGANPSFVVQGSSNPAGLIDTLDHSYTIPVAWSIKASTTTTVAAVAPVPAEPNNHGDPNSFQWIYMKDAATPTIESANTTAFQPGEIAVVMKNNVGIHYGQAPTEVGAENSPNYVFLEANFGAALSNHTYQTNRLTVEYFRL